MADEIVKNLYYYSFWLSWCICLLSHNSCHFKKPQLIEAFNSVHHGSYRTTYAAWDQTKPCKSWKAVCMLLRVMNGNQIMTHQVKPATTTLSSRESCTEESTLIHWNLSWGSVSRHTFSKLFQLHTCLGVLEKYFRTRGIDERDHNCECGQLFPVEHVLKECPLHSAERDLLRIVSPELNPKILLDTKKGLGAVVKFLDSLPQLLCWWFA